MPAAAAQTGMRTKSQRTVVRERPSTAELLGALTAKAEEEIDFTVSRVASKGVERVRGRCWRGGTHRDAWWQGAGPLTLAPLHALQVRVWWPPSRNPRRTGFCGAYWPAVVTKKGAEEWLVQYDNGETEKVDLDNIFPFEVPVDFGDEITDLEVRARVLLLSACCRVLAGPAAKALLIPCGHPAAPATTQSLDQLPSTAFHAAHVPAGGRVRRGLQRQQDGPVCLGGSH